MSDKESIDYDFSPPFSGLVVGNSGSGKTYLVRHLIKNYWKKCFQYIFIFSPTNEFSHDYDEFKLPGKDKHLQVFSEYDEKIIQEIIDAQKSLARRYPKTRVPETLIILDDCLDKIQGNHNLIQSIFWKCRHVNLSCIALVQKLKSSNTILRSNARLCVMFRAANSSEIEAFLEEFCGKRERRIIEAELFEHFKKPYSFLLADLKTQNFSKRYLVGSSLKPEKYIQWYD